MLLVFGVASLAAVVTGAVICAAVEVPAGLWARNLVAWAVGALLACGLAVAPAGALRVGLWAAPVGLAASFFSPALQGVHRWVDLGPVHLNAALVFLPPAVVALTMLTRTSPRPWAAGLAALALLVLQPDASQATTLAAIAVLATLSTPIRPLMRSSLIALIVGLAAASWLRPDPLQPAPEVEQIIQLAHGLSPIAAALALLCLTVTAAAPALLTAKAGPGVRAAGSALGLCLLLWSIMPFLGAYPVPLVGIGMSPIVGAWLGVGLLAGALRRDQRSSGSALSQPPSLASGAS